MLETNKIYNMDCLEGLKKLPKESVDCVVTSPPYWALRSYLPDDNPDKCKEIGSESTIDEFIKNLCNIFDDVKRVLKNEGTCFVVIGDTYWGSGTGTQKNLPENPSCKESYTMPYDLRKNKQRSKEADYKSKCLCLIPQRFVIEMVNRGWILRNEIVWYKRNAMCCSVRDRFTVDFEHVYFFTKSKKYFFEQQFEPHKNPVDVAYRKKIREGKRYCVKKPYENNVPYSVQPRTKDIVEYRDLPDIKEFSKYINANRKFAGFTIDEVESFFGNYAPHHWFNAESFPSKDDYLKLKQFLSFDDAYDRQMTEIFTKSSEKTTYLQGRNMRCVWDVPTKPDKSTGSHIAVFPEKLIEPMIRAGCPVGGVVGDPFFGAGTTGVVALKQQKHYLGWELNPDYIEIAEKRLKPLREQRRLV